MVTISICLALVESAYSGAATFYSPYVPSACFGIQDEGYYVAGVGDELWDNGAACGLLYEVVCTGPVSQGVPQPCTNEAVIKLILNESNKQIISFEKKYVKQKTIDIRP
ncbi:eg45-like domain containing protein [Quercus suber]|uniref:Eg45-like domain containing protein n=1 Tax=Quercus suber TaxID=58331 RepID=A0AAW0KKT3_QUESU